MNDAPHEIKDSDVQLTLFFEKFYKSILIRLNEGLSDALIDSRQCQDNVLPSLCDENTSRCLLDLPLWESLLQTI